MGCKPKHYDKVINTVREAVRIKRANDFEVTLGLQMVLLPEFHDQIIPLAKLGKELSVDYLVIKHCSDDESGSLGVDYSKYHSLVEVLRKAESFSDEKYLVKAKWSKILSNGKRIYSKCYGPPFLMQFSGSGLVAPCGMFFNDKYKKYHIGNIADSSFKEIWKSERYWEVVNLIASDEFDARKMCGCLCVQHKVNEFLWDIKQSKVDLNECTGELPMHVNFI
jgi:MoaA/NifB/PqqE/SkfB family radical SAM enzyme